MPLKFRFALLTAALMLVLSVNALANSGEGAPEAPAPAQEETAEKASPFAPLVCGRICRREKRRLVCPLGRLRL